MVSIRELYLTENLMWHNLENYVVKLRYVPKLQNLLVVYIGQPHQIKGF